MSQRQEGRSRRIFAWLTTDVWRIATWIVVLLLLLGSALFPSRVRVNGAVVTLIFVLVVLALAPMLKSAKLPGGALFKFRSKIEAAEHIGSDVQARSYLEPPNQLGPSFIEVSEEVRQLAVDHPADALAQIRMSLVRSLRRSTQGLAQHRQGRSSPDDPIGMMDYIARSGRVWPEQLALMRVIWDITNTAPLRGEVESIDAVRVIAVSDILNESWSLGYSIGFAPNESWEEQGLICQYEHCIENMPTPGVTAAEHAEWRVNIQKHLDEGFYEDDPKRKAKMLEMVADDPPDLPDEVDETGACPIFGHYCPGGESTVDACPAAQEWLESIEQERRARAGSSSDPSSSGSPAQVKPDPE